MKNRLIRLGLVGSLAVVVSAPMTAPANAWSCQDEFGRAMCLVANTTCGAVNLATGSNFCQIG